MSLNFETVLSWFFIINAIISVIVIILERRRPEKTIAWLLIFVVFPPLGLFLYLFVGRNWKKHKLNNESYIHTEELVTEALQEIKNVEYPSLIKLLVRNSNSPLFIDNDIKLYNNGEDLFNDIKEELLKAKHHIHLEYYIIKSDKIGNEIKDILIKKAKEGVKVRFIIDKVGSIRLKKSYIKELTESGIEVIFYTYFLAPLLRHVNTQINYRNHRKIIVIDGEIGFTGGFNIGDEYLGKSKLGFWRDSHIKVKGDFVLGLQAVFLDDFYMTKKNSDESFFYNINFDDYFPAPDKSQGKKMQLVKSGPDSENPSILQATLKMISLAKNNIYITTPYFIPPDSIAAALKVAALSGVKIRILFPGQFDHWPVYYASRTYLSELTKYGIQIYFYDKKSFVHSKTMTVDGKISTVGTANMDIRSYELNYELTAVVYDEETTKEFEKDFINDLKHSKLMTYEDFKNCSWFTKILEAITRVFSNLF